MSMLKTAAELQLKPRKVDPELLARLLRMQSDNWPKNLRRFAPFKRGRDGDDVRYRAVAYDRFERTLYVTKIISNACPATSLKVIKWNESDNDNPFSDVYLTDESIAPEAMKGPFNRLPAEIQEEVTKRMKYVHSLCYVDKTGHGRVEDFLFNDFVMMDEDARKDAIRYVIEESGAKANFRTQLCRLEHRFVHFGGGECALADVRAHMGRDGIRKAGRYSSKPGAKSAIERAAIQLAAVRGKKLDHKLVRVPIGPADLQKFVLALTAHWAKERKSIAATYFLMLDEHYVDVPEPLRPKLGVLYYHARQLIARYQLRSMRNGKRLSAMFDVARVGQATDITQGVLAIADIDGWVAKIPVAAMVRGVLTPIPITVLFAVCRNSGAIIGYEIALEGEKAEAYRRCIASIYTDKSQRAQELGLTSADGLLHGTIDAVFVDNGAGASEEVLAAACDEMRLMRMITPPARGDLKSGVENVNGIMIQLFLNERGAYTRGTDPLSKQMRLLARKERPITMTRFEQLLLLAIQHYNLHTNKAHLRAAGMAEADVDITPDAIFRHLQAARIADGKKQLTYRETLSRFVPWEERLVRRGVVWIQNLRFTSDSLVALFNEYAEHPNKEDRKLKVKVKRLDGDPKSLIWLQLSGEEGLLSIVDEDARRIGNVSWKGVELLHVDEVAREEALEVPRARSRARLTQAQNDKLVEAAHTRAQNDLGGAVGDTIPEARARAKAKRDGKSAAAYKKASGISATDIRVPKAAPVVPAAREDDEYEDFMMAETAIPPISKGGAQQHPHH